MRVNARETDEAESVRSTVRIQAFQRRADVLAGRYHLSTRLASPILLVVKRAVVLFRKAVKQAENRTCVTAHAHTHTHTHTHTHCRSISVST